MYYSFANTLVYECVISGNVIRDKIEEISVSGVRSHCECWRAATMSTQHNYLQSHGSTHRVLLAD